MLSLLILKIMNKILIADASESDRRLMSGLLTRAGYEPIDVGSMEAAKEEAVKLPPSAVVVTAIKGNSRLKQLSQLKSKST